MIVVTGGAGFIGSCFVKKLNDEGVTDIIIVDSLGNGDKWKNLVGKRFRSIIDKETFLYGIEDGAFTEKFEAVVHMGACTSTTERNADYLLENNFHYSTKLGMYCADKDIRLIYASSAASYGIGEHGYRDDIFRPLRPLNMYGFSKHMFDIWAIDNGLDERFTGFKFFNVFGPNEYHKESMASMVYKSYNQIVASGSVKLFKSTDSQYSDGGQLRDFVYVKDVVEILWKATIDSSISGIYNLGTGKARTWVHLVSAVFNALQQESSIEFVDMPESLQKQYQNYTEAEMTKLQQTSMKHNFASLEDSIADYVQNYLMHTWQYN